MPRSAPNSSRDVELRRADGDLAGLDLRQVEQVVDHLGERRRPPVRMNVHLPLAARRSAAPSAPVEQQPRQARMELSGVRNSWLMFARKRLFSSVALRSDSARSSSSA